MQCITECYQDMMTWDKTCRLTCCAPMQTPSTDSVQITANAVPGISGSLGVSEDFDEGPVQTTLSLASARSARRTSSLLMRTRSLESAGFLEEFALAEVLGQGSFSIVMACKARNPGGISGPSYAVKLVEKVEATPEDIEQEITIHMKLDHPNVLKLHKVFHEKCFVCMVVDLFEGGSLVTCLKGRQKLISGKIVHIGRQMVRAVEYIHSKHFSHRDIKADNFLADTSDLMDQSCRVVLADFGFACECHVGDRLKRQCGTRCYWSPEVYDRNYNSKSDLWALGVTFHGLVETSFPFFNEWDVKNKEVALCRVVSPVLADFIRQLLCKQEGQRLSAAGALAHPWLSGQREEGAEEEPVDVQGSGVYGLEALRAEPPDAAATERRLELVERLASTCLRREISYEISSCSFDSDGATPMSVLATPSFSVADKRASKIRTFEWWSTNKVKEMGMLSRGRDDEADSADAPCRFPLSGMGLQTQILAQLLEEFGVDTSLFGKGKAKTLERFAQEVESGFSHLMLDASKHKALVRVVEVVLLRICMVRPGGEERFMIVSADEQPDGRFRGDLNRLPGTKKLPHENVRNCSLRILGEIPGLADAKVIFDFEHTELFEVDGESPSYPGVRTVYRKEIVAGVLKRGANGLSGSDWVGTLGGNSTKFLQWLTEEECHHKNVTLTAPILGTENSCLVPAPLGLKVEALGRFLEANNVDLSMFGKNGAKTLQELSDELLTGESSLTCLPCGRVARVVDVVVLKLARKGTSDVLVVAKEVAVDGKAGDEVLLGRLPGSKRRPDESYFKAAKRVLRRQLNLSENTVTLDAEVVCTAEEEKDSPSYPGLHTIYRRRIIPATLDVMQSSVVRQFSSNRNMPDIMEENVVSRLSSISSYAAPKSPGSNVMGRIRRSLTSLSNAILPHRSGGGKSVVHSI